MTPESGSEDFRYVYPPDSQQSKEYDQWVNTGTEVDKATLRSLDEAIISGQITDPVKMEQAIRLRDKVYARTQPRRAIQNDRAQGIAAVKATQGNFSPTVRKNNQTQFNKDKYYMRQYFGNQPNPINRLGQIVVDVSDQEGQDYIKEIPRSGQLDPGTFPVAYKIPGDDVYVDGPGGASLATDDYNTLLVTAQMSRCKCSWVWSSTKCTCKH